MKTPVSQEIDERLKLAIAALKEELMDNNSPEVRLALRELTAIQEKFELQPVETWR